MYATSMRYQLQPSLCLHLQRSLDFKRTCCFDELCNRIRESDSSLQPEIRFSVLTLREREVLRSPYMRLEGSKIKFLQAIGF